MQTNWLEALKKVLGYSNINDRYLIGEPLKNAVSTGWDKSTGTRVAIKEMRKESLTKFQRKREIQILKLCEHPNVVHLRDVFENCDHYWMVFEFMEGGNLNDYLKARDFSVREDQMRQIAY